jgi:hypothetical protein
MFSKGYTDLYEFEFLPQKTVLALECSYKTVPVIGSVTFPEITAGGEYRFVASMCIASIIPANRREVCFIFLYSFGLSS